MGIKSFAEKKLIKIFENVLKNQNSQTYNSEIKENEACQDAYNSNPSINKEENLESQIDQNDLINNSNQSEEDTEFIFEDDPYINEDGFNAQEDYHPEEAFNMSKFQYRQLLKDLSDAITIGIEGANIWVAIDDQPVGVTIV